MLPLGGVLGPPSFPCGFRTGGSNGLVAGRFSEVLMPDTKVKNEGIPEISQGNSTRGGRVPRDSVSLPLSGASAGCHRGAPLSWRHAGMGVARPE
jgi:hypothetical protein